MSLPNDRPRLGFLRSSSFEQPISTAGGVFGSGGPRALVWRKGDVLRDTDFSLHLIG